MRKLKLDFDALQVETFVPDSRASEMGTVNAQSVIEEDDPGSTDCDPGTGGWFSIFGTCQGCPTQGTCIGPTYCCPRSWQGTCDFTCPICPL